MLKHSHVAVLTPTGNVVPAEKTCRKCAAIKPIHEFYARRKSTDGFSWSCKKCEGYQCAANYQKQKDRYIQQHRTYYNTNKTKFKELNREGNLRQFGITVKEFDEMYEAQGRGCKLCGGNNRDGRRLAVDHEHSTGIVRGLLCGECNQSLGKFKDSPDLLRKAAVYIENKGKI